MEVVMRGIDTPVRKMRREIFKEIAQLAYHSDNLNDDVEALPYKIVNPETPIYRESIYREREIVREPACDGAVASPGRCTGACDTGAGGEQY